MAEYPGFQRSKTLATAWINALTKQGGLMNDAWGNILAGNYGLKDAMRDGAQLYQNQYDIFDALLPSDPASALDVPSWLMLDVKLKLSDTVATRAYEPANVNLTTSELVSLAGSPSRFDMTVESASSTSLRVKVTTLHYKPAAGKEKAVELNSSADAVKAANAKQAWGPHIGLIYDQRSTTNAPLAVVTLLI